MYLKGSGCGLFSLKSTRWHLLRSRLYRFMPNWKWEKNWDYQVIWGKSDREKVNQCAFCFSSCTKQWWRCSTSTNSQVTFLNSGVLVDMLIIVCLVPTYSYNYLLGGSYLLRCASNDSVVVMNFVCLWELKSSLSRFLRRTTLETKVWQSEKIRRK